MKKIIYGSLLLLLVLMISACGKENSNSPANPSPDLPSYYGTWTVQSIVGSTPVSTEADESFIGMKAAYSDEEASFGTEELLNPQYKEQELTNEQFVSEYQNKLSDIGIESDKVRTVAISNWTNAGSSFIIKDDQTMIFLWDGNYYEMKKEQ